MSGHDYLNPKATLNTDATTISVVGNNNLDFFVEKMKSPDLEMGVKYLVLYKTENKVANLILSEIHFRSLLSGRVLTTLLTAFKSAKYSDILSFSFPN